MNRKLILKRRLKQCEVSTHDEPHPQSESDGSEEDVTTEGSEE